MPESDGEVTMDQEHRYWLVSREAGYVELNGVTRIIQRHLGIDFSDVAKEYAEFGTAVHSAIDLHLEENLDEDDLMDEIRPRLNAFKSFESETKFEWTDKERIVYNEEIMAAGRYDLRGIIGNREYLIDIKTGRKEKWHALQLAAYLMLADLDPRRTIRAGLYLKKDGTYKLQEYSDELDFSVFVDMAWLDTKRRFYV